MRRLCRPGLLRLVPLVVLLVILLPGCGDDDGGGPDLIVISDFEGLWVVEQYKATSVANPAVYMEIISLGAAMEYNMDDEGDFEGRAFIPAAIMGMTLEIPFAGNLELITQDTAMVSFTPEVPPFLTQTRAAFTIDGNTVEITDPNTTFDFGGGSGEEAAIFEGIMVRTSESYPTVIFTEDFEGFWEATSYTATSVANPAVSVETIAMGATYDFDVDATGNAIGNAFIPAALAGQDTSFTDFDASFVLMYQDSMMIAFDPIQPPFLVNAYGNFTLEGDELTLTDENALFDFDGNQIPEPAISVIVLERTTIITK